MSDTVHMKNAMESIRQQVKQIMCKIILQYFKL